MKIYLTPFDGWLEEISVGKEQFSKNKRRFEICAKKTVTKETLLRLASKKKFQVDDISKNDS